MINRNSKRQIKEPRLSDPLNIEEVFANEVANIEIGKGVCAITFATRRMNERGGEREPSIERMVRSRIVLPLATAEDLVNKLVGLNNVITNFQTLDNTEKSKRSN